MGPAYGWFGGWVAICAYAVANTTIAYLGAPWALTLLGIAPTPGAIVAAGIVLVVVCSLAGVLGIDVLERAVKAGIPVVLEFSSLDFVHGFNMPDLKLRADLPPGRVTSVRLPAMKPGVYEFLCDNFCGDKHEEMAGRMVVEV